MKDDFAAQEFKVLEVLTPMRLVLNCGTDQGVQEGDQFQVFAHGKVMTDPDTNEEIEALLLPRGTGKAIFVQKKICTIESTAVLTRTKPRSPLSPLNSLNFGLSSLYQQDELEVVPRAFYEPQRGDRATYVPPKIRVVTS